MIFKVLVLISVKIRFHSFVFCRTKIVKVAMLYEIIEKKFALFFRIVYICSK